MVQFTILDNAIAGPRVNGGQYATLLSTLGVATKNAEGKVSGQAVKLDKVGQVLSLRAAAKASGFAIVTRKQEDGGFTCWKIKASDAAPRKPHTKKKK